MPEDLINVLLVDDEEDFLSATSRALTRRGFRVYRASTGEEARSLFRLHEIDVAILDVRIPDADGHALFFELKGSGPRTEFIILTGHGDVQKACEMGSQGVFAYLSKPCDPEVLADEIRRAVAVRDEIGSRGPSGEAVPPGGSPPVTVLLVDDEPDFLASMKRILTRRGLQVRCASSGPEALEALKVGGVDVAVLDVRMHGMDGLELLRRIRPAWPEIEVIVLTGHATVDVAIQCMREGAFDYLFKPHEPDALVDRIVAASQRRRSQDARSGDPA